MKTHLLVLLLSVAALSANAQFKAGSKIITGDLNFGNSSSKFEDRNNNVTTETDGPKQSDFSISAAGGYFVSDRLAIGLGIGFAVSTGEEQLNPNTTVETRSNSISFVPFVRYYIPYSEKFAFFGDFSVGLGFGSYVEKLIIGNLTTEQKGTLNSLLTGITPGFNYMVHKNIGLEIRYGFLGYSSFSFKDDGSNPGDYSKATTTGIGLDFGLNSLNFGIVVFL
ncbi:MAG: outer membrane beta-barrel protein [Thermaurantimonas sp.]|uniref:outer membrane beta-barrel protein n=1 Tax=Thermaurantimonas sp. TaxID=2681568 RepID=UPI0039192E28